MSSIQKKAIVPMRTMCPEYNKQCNEQLAFFFLIFGLQLVFKNRINRKPKNLFLFTQNRFPVFALKTGFVRFSVFLN